MHSSWLENYNLLIFDQIDSTNSEALRIAKSIPDYDFVIIARNQLSARGQKKQKWVSITGNLHLSILLQPKTDIKRLKELSFLTAIILRKSVLSFCNEKNSFNKRINLKWPNDLLIDDKKLAGILLESINIVNKIYVVVGIGLNTHFFPHLKERKTTSLLNEGIVLENSDDFLNVFMSNFHNHYLDWQNQQDFTNLKNEWLKHAYKLGQKITVKNGDKLYTGIFSRIDNEGCICIKLDNGKIKKFMSIDALY